MHEGSRVDIDPSLDPMQGASGMVTQFTMKRRGMTSFSASMALVSIALVISSLSQIHGAEGAMLVVWFAAISFWTVSLGTRMWRARRRPIEIEEDALVQYADGREVARVRLDRSFEVQYLFKGYFEALYRIRQGRSVLTFSNKTPGAEPFARDMLGLEWPPIGRWWT